MGCDSSKSHHDPRAISRQPPPSRSLPPGLPGTRARAQQQVSVSDLSTFAVVTVIFNPVNYESRYELYHKFKAHMADSGVFLLTVECLFESATRFGLPQQKYKVTRAGDLTNMQVVAPSIIWMKENLINVAVRRLPPHVEYVAWLDADIEFNTLEWPHLTIAELQRYPIVQVFELSLFLGPSGKKEILRRDYSFAYSIRHNKPIDARRSQEWYAHPGYAWAMRRAAFNAIGGLLDFSILGSGDLHFAYALLDRIGETFPAGLHEDYRRLAIVWADQVNQVAREGDNVGYVPVTLLHHWHGTRTDRAYVERWGILERHQFSPLNDLETNDTTGIICLSDKRQSGRSHQSDRMEALESDIVAYFRSRNEDKKSNDAKPQPRIQPQPAEPHLRPTGIRHVHSSSPDSRRASSHTNEWWTSGPVGTHVDDDNCYPHHCLYPEHHHHDSNHHCPCSSHYHDDPNCWNPGEHENHHQDNEDRCTLPDGGGHDHDHSSNGGGHDYHGGGYEFGRGGDTGFTGPGSFY